MPDEIAIYLQELAWVLEQIAQTLRDYPPGRLGWRPASGTSNSAAAIASHVLSATRVYVLGFGCGQDVARDRAAEFAADPADSAALLAALRQLVAELGAALPALAPPALDRRLRPPQELWGAITEPREISAREAIVMGLRHAALHLGELRLTRDLAARA